MPENIAVQRPVESNLVFQEKEQQYYFNVREQEKNLARRFTFAKPIHDHEKKDEPIMLFSSGVDKLGDDFDQVPLSGMPPNNPE
ncbi:hypothetical protein OAP56_01050 [Rickettsiaceae bacterium]|nr:hypothetical protein [Rickettsiaceae bacterium]